MTYSDYAAKFIGVKQGSTKHKYIINEYNKIRPLPRGYKVKYYDNWCATFVSFVLYKCGCRRNVFECGAHKMRDKCRKLKYILPDKTTGKKNDIIFYDWNGDDWIDHVGIIQKVSKDTYTVIEGNKNKAVGIRTIKKGSSSIEDIARIK